MRDQNRPSKDQFQEWKEDRVTLWVNQYLKDSITEEAEILSETIANGGILSELEQVSTSALISTLRRISEIGFEEIEDFYTEE